MTDAETQRLRYETTTSEQRRDGCGWLLFEYRQRRQAPAISSRRDGAVDCRTAWVPLFFAPALGGRSSLVGSPIFDICRLTRNPDPESLTRNPGQVQQISQRIEGVLAQLPAAIKQAHERLIGGRKLPNKDKILSLYDADVEVIVRGKSGAAVEFGNNLWLGETREGVIVDYLLEKDKTSDAKQIEPAIRRLVEEQGLAVGKVWGDRALQSAANETALQDVGIYSGLCPRNVKELAERLNSEPGMREGLKRRAGTEARVSIIIRKFMGKPARAKGFEHRAMMVGWAVLAHNLWVIARLERAPPREGVEGGLAEAA